MTESPDQPRSAAIEQLETLGYSAYAARTFVALVALGEGTAQEVSAASEVPRTRVYDAVDELRREELVIVEQSTPKRFRPVPATDAEAQFHEQYTRRIETLGAALAALEASEE